MGANEKSEKRQNERIEVKYSVTSAVNAKEKENLKMQSILLEPAIIKQALAELFLL